MGPVLFIIYVNDLPEVVQSKLWMFADDTKIYHTISSNEYSVLLHSGLHSIMRWCSMWLMNLNYDKCKNMSFGNHTFPTSQYLRSIGEERISVDMSVNSLIWECFSLQILNLEFTYYYAES